MQKELEITYIEDNDLARQNMLNKYVVGSWIILSSANASYLCVIAQTDSSIITAICIEDLSLIDFKDGSRTVDANRMMTPFKLSGTHDKLSTTDINFITKNGEWKIEKVNVQINVYTKEQA